jgi:hypothetical protein
VSSRIRRLGTSFAGVYPSSVMMGEVGEHRRRCSPTSPYTNAKLKPAWSGARPMEIPPWLWCRCTRRRLPEIVAEARHCSSRTTPGISLGAFLSLDNGGDEGVCLQWEGVLSPQEPYPHTGGGESRVDTHVQEQPHDRRAAAGRAALRRRGPLP